MNVKSIIAAIVLVAAPLCANAQSDKSNEALSNDLKHQINILNADIKAIKARKKADPSNAEYDTQLTQKQQELKTAKERKSVIDDAIKAAKKSEKETKQAEDAKKKAEKAHSKAESLRKSENISSSKSSEQLSNEYDSQIDIAKADIKALKARKKANPNDSSIQTSIKQKEAEVKELQRKKKIIDEELKTSKKADKEADQAEKAQRKHEKASDKADDVRSDM